jgi:sec-independent protein translocase protein TatA
MEAHAVMVPALFDLSTTHLIIILVILLLLFGSRLPGIMRNLGSSVSEFKKGMDTKPEAQQPPTSTPEGTVSRNAAPPPVAPTASAAPTDHQQPKV